MNKALKFLKHLFIPHKHNDFKPHFFRELSVTVITGVLIVVLAFSVGSNIYIERNNLVATVLPAVLVDLTNTARTSDNELPLTRNSVLDRAAQMKANDMAQYNYFAHTSPIGVTPWYWFDKVGYYFIYAGENLAINFDESSDVETAWLNSPGHRANILNTKFTEIGIATAQGMYQGNQTTYVVQMFGTPSIPTAEVETPANVTPIKKVTSKPKAVALVPAVKGASVSAVKNLQTITDTKDFVSVFNKDAALNATPAANPSNTKYSSWTDRFVFLTPKYADKIYKVIMYVVIAALLIMVFAEIRIQHKKNITYGILLIVIIFCLIYLNRVLLMPDFLV